MSGDSRWSDYRHSRPHASCPNGPFPQPSCGKGPFVQSGIG
ncbi:hypothetical protein ACFPM0_01540 [Pseudonocardia sulfidoxydans]